MDTIQHIITKTDHICDGCGERFKFLNRFKFMGGLNFVDLCENCGNDLHSIILQKLLVTPEET